VLPVPLFSPLIVTGPVPKAVSEPATTVLELPEPPLITSPPENELFPESVSVPVPSFVRPPVPERSPE